VSDTTIVALGCSTYPDYSYLLPITALLWRRVSFSPVGLLIGTEDSWKDNPRTRVVLKALNDLTLSRLFVAIPDGYSEATTAQNCRQHAACAFNDEWMIPADADLFPIRQAFYSRHEGSPFKAVSYYFNGDHFLGKTNFLSRVAEGKRSQTIPTCHVAMRMSDWRDIYGLEQGECISTAIKCTLDDWFARFPKDDFNVWMSDQDILTERLCRQSWFPKGTPPEDGEAHSNGDVLFVGRKGHPPQDRLCRSVPELWEGPFDPDRWVDAHVHKNPMSDEHWPKLLEIVDTLLPEHSDWARRYRGEYIEAAK